MTDKEQIIINGVDVSGCEYLTNELEEDGEYYWFCNIAPAGGPDECEYKPECFYKKILKQLARKTQECEELKSESFTRESLISMQEKDIDRYRKALEEIEELACCIKNFNFGYDELSIGQDIINKAKGR